LGEQISVIVTTYNRIDALDAVLRGFARQSDRGFEVIIADDGSAPPAREILEARARGFEFPIKHVWHADNGFRAGEIRNRAILASRGSYCIFLDGDCIPRPDFIAVWPNRDGSLPAIAYCCRPNSRGASCPSRLSPGSGA
jgi:glycosyltransferase involved in cell wall biosynthesis